MDNEELCEERCREGSSTHNNLQMILKLLHLLNNAAAAARGNGERFTSSSLSLQIFELQLWMGGI
jgi:hypothetical protein